MNYYIIKIYLVYTSKNKKYPKDEFTLFRRIKDRNKE